VGQLGLDAHLAGLPEAERTNRRQGLIGELQANTAVTYAQSAPGVYVVTISHGNPDADLSHKVVAQLAASYQSKSFERPVEAQQKVVEQHGHEVEEAQRELDRISTELKEFEQEHAEFLEGPEERLSSVRDDIEQVESVEIAHAKAEIGRLDTLLKSEPEEIVYYEEIVDQTRLAEAEKQKRETEKELTVLRVEQHKTDHHPKVKAKLEILKRIELEIKSILAEKKTVPRARTNPMHKSLFDAKVELEGKMALAHRKLEVLRRKEQDLLTDVQRAPDIKQERDRLRGEERLARVRYEERQAKHKEALDSLQALSNQRQLEFETIDPPTRPTHPAGPSALLIALMGLAIGAGAGVGLAYVFDSMDSSFREVEQVSAALGVPVLGAIHLIETESESRAREGGGRRALIGVVVLGLVAVGAVAFAMFGDVGDVQQLLSKVLK
jgi:uncharacterized protein involved in exopolysaccharide biosynthesis